MLPLLLLFFLLAHRAFAQESCSPSNPCPTDPNGTVQFCNFDFGADEGGFCEPCADHPDACVSFGLPNAGTLDCETQCTARRCSKDEPCSGGGEYYCNFDDGPDVGGFCEFCGWMASSEDCPLQGLPDAGAASCSESCEVYGGTEEVACSELEPCQDGSFCDFSLDDGTSGHCWECEWHPHEFCFGPDLSEAGAKSCAEACASECSMYPGEASLTVGGKEYSAVGMIGSPTATGVSGPLIHCPDLLCGDGVDVSSGVCLIKRGEHSFYDKAISCEERGGIAALIYDDMFLDGYGVMYDIPGIPSFGIPEAVGLSLLEGPIGSLATVSLDEGEEFCNTGCSDLLPCPGEKSFCNYDYDSYGTCEECWIDEGSAEDDCFFVGLPLRGAQECASTCGSRLQFPTCKFCPSDLSLNKLGSGLQEGGEVCEFCPGGLQKEYESQQVAMFGEGVDCFLLDEFYRNYQIAKSEPNCQLAQTVNYLCGCESIGYGGANTKSKQAALAWVPRVVAILSFLCSAFIIFDVTKEKKRREKLFGQLMVGLSTFDMIGSAAYSLTSLPLPAEDYIYGSQGNMATCKAQGFFIQLGTISSYMNLSLAVYYLLVIKYSWSENRIKKWRIGLFAFPILVGIAFACAGFPFYDNMILWCNNSASYWPEIPLCITIFSATLLMSSVCVHVHKESKASARWRQGGAGSSLSEAVFWQSFWFTFAFYITWVPYLALQFMWASGKAYSRYGFILYAGTACTAQGFWNFFVYMRPRTKRFNSRMTWRRLGGIRSTIRTALSTTRSTGEGTGKTTGKASSCPISASQTVPRSDVGIETAAELADRTAKITADNAETNEGANLVEPSKIPDENVVEEDVLPSHTNTSEAH